MSYRNAPQLQNLAMELRKVCCHPVRTTFLKNIKAWPCAFLMAIPAGTMSPTGCGAIIFCNALLAGGV